MNTELLIIDNFYDDPEMIRGEALKLNYNKHPEDTYPGKNSDKVIYDKKIHNKFEKILQKKLTPANHNGIFRISKNDDSFKQDIHVDVNFDYIGIIYLNNENLNEKSGTSFWYHTEYKIDKIPNDIHEINRLGYSSHDELFTEMTYVHGIDRKKWVNYHTVIPKFNRLLIFNCMLWHSHGENFGTNKYDSRMVQLFFFNIEQKNYIIYL